MEYIDCSSHLSFSHHSSIFSLDFSRIWENQQFWSNNGEQPKLSLISSGRTFFINVLFVAVMGLLSLKWSHITYFDSCYGLWPIVFAIIMENSLENPDGEGSLMCLPIIVKNKYYPLFLLLLFSLLSQKIKIDLICAMLVGFIHHKWLNTKYFNYLNDRRMANWSKSCVFNCLRSFKSYIPGHLSAYDIPYGRNANNDNSQYEAPSAFQAFKGRGVTIGSDEPVVATQHTQGYYVPMPESEITNNRPQQNQI